ncbi:Domain of unknown function DUF1934 [Desulfofarcimen acetoxidans DSM 771]|jgi:uncharacterized beta-barrel protein YwiB (DUF1934 family)|uniref:DUF1934 domain-containing protein n=1 Tax=Desulfofarcimen acetoxidans (strain ATCC 49208 / DSM 771 / KCTC 5769 / VKM B-1644 / 5575) TaxID=485916 RepID=C8VVE5_DESAS|nr:DUF1934 domain-containing protein [Desulfofarcimen acetoxidans]ACV61014.1 Domain of unknown function DUF1934 [Desulfofarcimen acetoxidans DSM 771]
MRKEVLVTVRGTQTNDFGEQDTIELVTMGSYYLKNSSYYIVYNETELSGMEGTVTSVKAEADKVTVNRMGTSEMKHVFEEGVPDEGSYVTPFGQLFTSVFPRKVEVDLTDVGGSINLEYELALDRQRIGYNELCITVKEV